MEENEIRTCSWCGLFVEIREERIVRSKSGNVLLHDEKGRLHLVCSRKDNGDGEQERDLEQAGDFDRLSRDIFGDGDSTNTEGE